MKDAFRLSVGIPLHNEEAVLPELLRRTLSVLDELPGKRFCGPSGAGYGRTVAALRATAHPRPGED